MTKLIIDRENNNFLIQGCFYGYIENKILFLFSSEYSNIIPLKHIRNYKHYEGMHSSKIFSDIHIMRIDKSYFSESSFGFYPDIYFSSEYLYRRFIKFLNSYE